MDKPAAPAWNMAYIHVSKQKAELEKLGLPDEFIEEFRGVVVEPNGGLNDSWRLLHNENFPGHADNIKIITFHLDKQINTASDFMLTLDYFYPEHDVQVKDRELVGNRIKSRIDALMAARAYRREVGKWTEKERLLDLYLQLAMARADLYGLAHEVRRTAEWRTERVATGKRRQVEGAQEGLKTRRARALERDAELQKAWDSLPEGKRHHGAGVALAQAHQKLFPGRDGAYPGQRTYDKFAGDMRAQAKNAIN